jgi:hypothetical protein
MSRTAGRTALGRTINQIASKAAHSDNNKNKTASAIILTSVGDNYTFRMGLLDDNRRVVSETKPIRLIGEETELASRYGAPSALTRGNTDGFDWEVIIYYSGSSVNSKSAYAVIHGKVYETKDGKYEAVKSANELLAKGTSWAPPGAGV